MASVRLDIVNDRALISNIWTIGVRESSWTTASGGRFRPNNFDHTSGREKMKYQIAKYARFA